MVYVTHDIDWISPLHPFSVAKAFTHGNKWLSLNKIIQPGIFIKHIHKLMEFNQAEHINAIWLIGAPMQNSYQKMGLRYTFDCRSYKNLVKTLVNERVKIGLHSVQSEDISKQFQALQSLVPSPIKFHRSHYLKFDSNKLFPRLQQHHIATDFSLGQARQINLPEQPPISYGVNCVPTILFDNLFFFQKPDEAFKQFEATLQLAQSKQQDVAILFHPENLAINPRLWDYYKDVLRIAGLIS